MFRCLLLLALTLSASNAPRTFTNPVLPSGPDPWVIVHGGYYYFMCTTGKNLTIWKTRTLADLRNAPKRIVWIPPAIGPYSHDIWAPELHYLDSKWYIYFAADAAQNETHRLWVLENPSADPTEGFWTMKGKLSDPGDHWAIDGSVFKNGGKLFLIWSGWPSDQNGTQAIYIALLRNPWTIASDRVQLSQPEYDWEEHGDLPQDQPKHVNVNEGPEILSHAGKLFLIYSASGCWTENYELGMLTARSGTDLLNPASWHKSQSPVFTGSAEAHAFSPGHNGFFQSPDHTQNWIIYHANSAAHQGCGSERSPRMQPFTWNSDGSPNFGRPLPISKPILRPSGEASN